MKILCFLLFLIWAPENLIEIGKYVHKGKHFEFQLTINSDSTFTYSRPAFMKGIIKEAGTWEILENNLILKDSIQTIFLKSKVHGQKDEKKNFVEITFLDENEKPLSGWNISLNDNGLIKTTDNLGQAIFNYSEIKPRRSKQPQNTVEVISFSTKAKEISIKVDDIFDNQITVIHDFNPQTINQYRQRIIEIKNGALLFKNPTGINEQQVFEFRLQKN